MQNCGFVMWCNQNQGFISAILSVLALFISVMTIVMTYRLGRLPYKKKLKFVPNLYKKENDFYLDVQIINAGNMTVCIDHISIANNKHLDVGISENNEMLVLKPCEYATRIFRIYDGIEEIEKKSLDINGYIVIKAHDVDGKVYRAGKGYPVG